MNVCSSKLRHRLRIDRKYFMYRACAALRLFSISSSCSGVLSSLSFLSFFESAPFSFTCSSGFPVESVPFSAGFSDGSAVSGASGAAGACTGCSASCSMSSLARLPLSCSCSTVEARCNWAAMSSSDGSDPEGVCSKVSELCDLEAEYCDGGDSL